MHPGSYYDSIPAIEMKNKIPSLSLTMMLIYHQWLLWNSSFFFFAMLVSLYDVISCDTINFENVREILRYFF